MSVPESRAQELYRLPGPRFTGLLLLFEFEPIKAVWEVRCEDAAYAPRFCRFVESVSFPFGSTGLGSVLSFFMPSYFQDSRTSFLNFWFLVCFSLLLILSKTLDFLLYPSGRVEGFQ